MFSVTIAFGTSSWRLLYKTLEKAQEHFTFATTAADKTQSFNPEERIGLEDDFGQRACFVRSAIVGVMLENMNESKLGAIELALHQARTQAGAQQRAESDPTMRAAQAARTPILTPMGSRFNG